LLHTAAPIRAAVDGRHRESRGRHKSSELGRSSGLTLVIWSLLEAGQHLPGNPQPANKRLQVRGGEIQDVTNLVVEFGKDLRLGQRSVHSGNEVSIPSGALFLPLGRQCSPRRFLGIGVRDPPVRRDNRPSALAWLTRCDWDGCQGVPGDGERVRMPPFHGLLSAQASDDRGPVRLYFGITMFSAGHLCRNFACDQMLVFSFIGFQATAFLDFPKWRKKRVILKSLSVAKLKDLRGKVDAAITEKVGARRRELEVQLSGLARYDPRGTRGTAQGRGTRGLVAPKYRNPKDPSQTWAGRGLQPHWLRDAIKSGKKLDSFLIAKG
jgi:DNA-binding protein H-NS